MRRLFRAALVAGAALAIGRTAHAQALGPQRQFLAVEPYYEHTSLDLGDTRSKDQMNGFGARLWVNLDPFHFILNSSLALYASHAPSQGGKAVSMTTWGAEYDQFFVRRPIGGLFDPFLTIGGGGTAVRGENSTVYGRIGSDHTFGSILPGGGVRIAVPNRFELRIDAKDLVIFNTPTGTSGASRTTNNLLLQAGLGITF